jgi:hypothetical protein
MPNFHMGWRGGARRRPRGSQVFDTYEQEAGPEVRAAGLVAQAGLQKASPVLHGALRANWATSGVVRVGTRIITRVTNNMVYAHWVDVNGKSAGYIDRGLDSVRPEVRKHLSEGARRAAAACVRGTK